MAFAEPRMRRLGSASLALAVIWGTTGCAPTTPGPTTPPAAAAQQPQTRRPDRSAPLLEPPVPAASSASPLRGAKLFVDDESLAARNAKGVRRTDPEAAAIIERIAKQSQGLWLGEWNGDVFRTAEMLTGRALAQGAVPVFITFNIPHRDAAARAEGVCYACGGLSSQEAYRRWVRDVHAGIGESPAAVVIEPDALAGIDTLPDALQKERLLLLQDAIKVYRQNSRAAVYLDAGNPAWQPAAKMAEFLKQAGVEHAHGFALNISNYRTTEECLKYGQEISALLGGKSFVIDTSRNGAGPYLEAKNDIESWCNPPGRKLGKLPTTDTGNPLADAFLWLKHPGESDGECSGGPRAGAWWHEMAIQLAR